MRGRKGQDRNDSNRFSILADPLIKKAKSCHSANTNPVSVFKNPNPKYLLISSLHENLPLSKVSPFILKKTSKNRYWPGRYFNTLLIHILYLYGRYRIL